MKKLKFNYFMSCINNLISFTYPLLILPYLTKIFSPEQLGIRSYINTILYYFLILGELGTNLYGTRLVAYNQNKKTNLKKYFNEILMLKLILILVIYIFFLIYNLMFNKLYISYFFISSLVIIARIFDINWYFNGIEKYNEIFLRNIVIKIITFIIIMVFVRKSNDFSKLLLIFSLSEVIGNMIIFIKGFNIVDFKYLVKTSRAKYIFHFFQSLKLFIPRSLETLYMTIDKLVLSYFHLFIELTYYDITQLILKIPQLVISSLTNIMFSRISNLVSNNQKTRMRVIIRNTVLFSCLITIPTVFGIMVLKKEMILIFLGVEYLALEKMLLIGSGIIFFNSLNLIIKDQVLLPLKQEKKAAKYLLIMILFNSLGNIIIVSKLGVVGILIVSLFSEILLLIFLFKFIREILEESKFKIEVLKIFFATIVMTAQILLLKKFFKITDKVSISLVILLSIIIYLIILFILNEEIIVEIRNIFLQRKDSLKKIKEDNLNNRGDINL